MDEIDRAYLAELISKRDRPNFTAERAYFQGRIDEYCAQNDVEQQDTTLNLDLGHPLGLDN